LEAPVVLRLRLEGHDVLSIAEQCPGVEDRVVLEQAARSRRVLVTNDKDFAELAFLQRQLNAGIVLLRLPRFSSRSKALRLVQVIGQQGHELRHAMTVIEEGGFRRRPLPRLRRGRG
jgi:predicted nuclease of predicted toxin-antitoxin system